MSATTTAASDVTAAPVTRDTSLPRRDIQGLRALAVTLVVLSHFWPGRLTGGYVGVDVFFVISGFLITSHLLTNPPQRWRDLGAFWGRRVRRLLPAATLVLLASLVGSVLFLPATALPRIAHETTAAALYVENWSLASSSTDYFAADDLPTPVQHYWSLSVEEQFYLVWPLVIVAALWCARRARGRFPCVGAALATVFIASLVLSLRDTATNPAAAYFVTPTRMWELALGGLVGLAEVRGARLVPRAGRAPLAWLGLAAITAAAFLYDDGTPFPGIAALLPTVGAAVVIASATDGVVGSPDRAWSLRGVQLTGDGSYSIYLWHWPLLVIVPFVLDRPLSWPVKVALVAVAFLLGRVTKAAVEDPVRHSHTLAGPLWRTFLVGGLLMGVTATAATAVGVHEEHAAASATDAVADALRGDTTCVGAGAARHPSTCDFVGTKLLTPATFAKDDKARVYADHCWNSPPFTSRKSCMYGTAHPEARIALVGNSHAGSWEPALADLAEKHDWQVTTYLTSECYTVDAVQVFDDGTGENCLDLARWQIRSVAQGGYDLVVVANRTWRQLEGVPPDKYDATVQELYGDTLSTWTRSGIPVLAVADIPYHPSSVPDCVAEHPDDLTACATPETVAVPHDPLARAARADRSGDVSVLDVTDRFCADHECRGVVGGVIAYFDQGHMSATFSRTLEPDVEKAVMAAFR
ncbi:Putative O-acetyltransferase [Luteimicrobium xylanilyticum]|uniref:O-acetyltransferase n=1 Tax=Luteimicrobium xylanilyticum TaxID=1133546 RepID=A0A5P9QF47_9MICO|nr:acyltransferase family protein [Luteimicrobium xylanilyticum]QFU99065.1 Putative O-acetyltransferase [Luteimicrobium xylanilyticum]